MSWIYSFIGFTSGSLNINIRGMELLAIWHWGILCLLLHIIMHLLTGTEPPSRLGRFPCIWRLSVKHGDEQIKHDLLNFWTTRTKEFHQRSWGIWSKIFCVKCVLSSSCQRCLSNTFQNFGIYSQYGKKTCFEKHRMEWGTIFFMIC